MTRCVVLVTVILVGGGCGAASPAAPRTSAACASAQHPWQQGPTSPAESGDGLPPAGTATQAAAEAVLAESRATLLEQFGASEAGIRLEPGRAWRFDDAGDVAIDDEEIATIVLTLPSTTACPAEPNTWGGVPLTFEVTQ